MPHQRKQTDWAAIYARIHRALTPEVAPLDGAAKRALLRERARRLAQRRVAEETTDDSLSVILFALGAEHYAVPATDVREVLSVSEVTPLPGPESLVLGMVNVRMQILPLFDLKPLVNLPRHEPTRPQPILVLAAGGECALAVDAIQEMGRLRLADLSRPASTDPATSIVRGVASTAILLDALALGQRLQSDDNQLTPDQL